MSVQANLNPPKYPILDATGKIRQWLEQGRGVRVWQSQLIGKPANDVLTPADTVSENDPPHWEYRGGCKRVLRTMNDVVFFEKSCVYFDGDNYWEWHDSPQGRRAAEKAYDNGEYKGNILPKDNGDYPIKMLFNYTLETLTYESTARVSVVGRDDRPLSTHFRLAIVQWSARIN
jgi:hypothetical protein